MTPRGVKLTLWLVGAKPYKFSLSLKVLLIQLLLIQSQLRHESVFGEVYEVTTSNLPKANNQFKNNLADSSIRQHLS